MEVKAGMWDLKNLKVIVVLTIAYFNLTLLSIKTSRNLLPLHLTSSVLIGGKDMHERKIDEVEDLISYRSGKQCLLIM